MLSFEMKPIKIDSGTLIYEENGF